MKNYEEIKEKIKEVEKHLFQIMQEASVVQDRSIVTESSEALDDVKELDDLIFFSNVHDKTKLIHEKLKDLARKDEPNIIRECYEDERLDQDRLEDKDREDEEKRKHHEDDIIG